METASLNLPAVMRPRMTAQGASGADTPLPPGAGALSPPKDLEKPPRHAKPGPTRTSAPRDARHPAGSGIVDGTLSAMADGVMDRVTIGSWKTGPSRADEREGAAETADGIRDRVTIAGAIAAPGPGAVSPSPGMEIFVGIRGRVALAYAAAS